MESATIQIDKRALIGSNISVKNQSSHEDKSTERGLDAEKKNSNIKSNQKLISASNLKINTV